MTSTPCKMASIVLLFLIQPAVISSECWTCQTDDDCSFSHETTVIDNTKSKQFHPFKICNTDYLLCVNKNNLLSIDCPCWNGEDCDSGRCEGLVGTCQPRLDAGALCNEDSDCVSGNCGDFIIQCLTEEPTFAPEERTNSPYAYLTQLPSPGPIVNVDVRSGNEDVSDLFLILLVSTSCILGLVLCLVLIKNLESNEDEYDGKSRKRNEGGLHAPDIIDVVPPSSGGDIRGDVGGCSGGGDFGGCDCHCDGGCDCGGCDCVIS